MYVCECRPSPQASIVIKSSNAGSNGNTIGLSTMEPRRGVLVNNKRTALHTVESIPVSNRRHDSNRGSTGSGSGIRKTLIDL